VAVITGVIEAECTRLKRAYRARSIGITDAAVPYAATIFATCDGAVLDGQGSTIGDTGANLARVAGDRAALDRKSAVIKYASTVK